MSNRRRLPGSGPVVRCAVHGGRIGKLARRVDTVAGPVCGRCVDAGALLRRLDCGHWSTAGCTVVQTGGGYTCAFCSQDAFEMKERTS